MDPPHSKLVAIALTVAGVIAVVAIASWLARRPAPPPAGPSTAGAAPAASATASTPVPAPADASTMVSAEPGVPPDHPAVRNYERYSAFQTRTRTFFDGAAKLSAEERRRGAQAIAGEIDAQEKDGKLLPVESLYLQLALLKHTSANEDEYKAAAERMVSEFRARAERAQAEQTARALADPRFVNYKAREVAIVEEANALPEGPARDEYLRKRLEDARIEAYANAAKPAPR